jgi:hypothetical protein
VPNKKFDSASEAVKVNIKPTGKEASPSKDAYKTARRSESGANSRNAEETRKANTTFLSAIRSTITRSILSYQDGMSDQLRGRIEYGWTAFVCTDFLIIYILYAHVTR